MKRTSLHYPKSPLGFTLIEILVVAAMISLFSGLALFSMSYMASQSKRKAANADARSISDALTVVQMRHGVYPKFPFMSMTQGELQALSAPQYPLPASFDYLGSAIPFPRATKILKNWEGPFLPSFVGRTVTGKSGVVKMRLPEQPQNTPSGQLYDWPADYWGNPYVLYITDIPSRIVCVVSYGPNGIPGGGDPVQKSMDGTDFNGPEVEQIKQLGKFYRLFRPEGDHFLALKYEEVENDPMPPPFGSPVNHLLALKSSIIVGGTERGYMEGVGDLRGRVPGILDRGSDDLVVHVH